MTRKVYAITLGTGATRCHQTLKRFTDQCESDQMELNQIAIDTGSVNDVPGDATRLRLNAQRPFRQRVRQAYTNNEVPYIHDIGALSSQGATRNRSLGRAQLEDKSGEVLRTLESEIQDDLRHNDDISEAIIVVMAALSGGSGSAMCLPVGLMSQDIADAVDADQGCNVDLKVVTALTVPQLNPGSFAGNNLPNAQQHLNTHAALRELLSAQGLTDDDLPNQIEFPISTPGTNSPQSLELSSPVYDAVFLAPLNEREVESSSERDETTSHREAVNWTLAHLVTALGLADIEDGIENLFEPDGGALREQLYTINLADVRAPIQLARQYLEIKDARNQSAESLDIDPDPDDHVDLQKITQQLPLAATTLLRKLQQNTPAGTDSERSDGIIQQIASQQFEHNTDTELLPRDKLKNRLSDLQEEIADDKQLRSLTAERNFVTAVLNDDFTPGEIPSVLADGPLSHAGINARDWMTQVNLPTLSLDEIEQQVHAIAESVSEPTNSGPRDRQTIAQYGVAAMFETYIRHRRNNHSFDQEATDAWNEWRQEAMKIDPGVEHADSTLDRYDRGIRAALQDEITDREQQLEELGVLAVRKKNKLKSEIEQLQDRLDELNRLYEEAKTLETLATEVRSALVTPARTATQTVREEVCDKIADLREERRKTRIALRRQQAELESTAEQLASAETHQIKRIPLNLETLEDTTPDSLDARSLSHLLETDLVDPNQLADQLGTVLSSLHEPLQDSQHDPNSQAADELLTTITAGDNEAIKKLDPQNAPGVETVLDARFPDRQDLSVPSVNRPFSLGFLAIYRGVDPMNMSELRWITEQRLNGSLGLVFEGRVNTALACYTAYPELLDDPAATRPDPSHASPAPSATAGSGSGSTSGSSSRSKRSSQSFSKTLIIDDETNAGGAQ